MTTEMTTLIAETVGSEILGIWFLIGAALVFFMQAGFAMVETGFTRAKHAGNIIMKNLIDFCIGTCTFILLGFGLLLGEDALGGFIGIPTLGFFTDYAKFDWSNLCLTWFSGLRQQQLYQEQWQKERNVFLIAFIRQLFLQWYIR